MQETTTPTKEKRPRTKRAYSNTLNPIDTRKAGAALTTEYQELKSQAEKALAKAKAMEARLINNGKMSSQRYGKTLICGHGDRYEELTERYETEN